MRTTTESRARRCRDRRFVLTGLGVAPNTRRLALIAMGISVSFGIVEFVRWNLGDRSFWGTDFDVAYRSAWTTYADPGFLWSPVAALLMRPLTVLPEAIAFAALTIVKLAAVMYVLRRDRVALLAILTFVPVLQDLVLGNVWLLIGLLVYRVAEHDSLGRGVLLGILAAAIPKPMLVPVFIWMILRRPEAFKGALAGGLVASLVGIAFMGIGVWQTWLTALLAGTRFAVPFDGNIGLTGVAPQLYLPVAAVAIVAFGLVLWRGRDGLVWGLGLGVLAAPYAGMAAAVPLVLVRSLWRRWWLLPFAQLGIEISLPLTIGLVMLVDLVGSSRPAAMRPFTRPTGPVLAPG